MTAALVNGFASEFLSRIWLVTWQVTLIALVVWTICRSKTLSSRTKCWLWWAVSLRMLFGLLPLGGVPLPILPPQPQAAPNMPFTVSSHRQPSVKPPHSQVDSVPRSVSTSSEASGGVADPGPSRSTAPAAWLFGIWVAGVLLSSLRIFAQGLAARKLIREATPMQDALISDLFARLLTEARIRQIVALLEHRKVNGPLLVGVLRPRVLLPTEASSSFSPEELRLALSHEVIHIRRNDLLFAFVPYMARTLFFFHPLAWLVVREHRLALEAACDRDALVLTGGPVSDYGRLLLRLAATADHRTSAALGAASNYRVLERRLKMLQFPSSSSRTGTVTLIMAIAAVTGIFIPWRLEAQRSREVEAAAKQPQEADQAVVVTTAQAKPAHTTKRAQRVHSTEAVNGATTATAVTPHLTPAAIASTPTSVVSAPTAAAIASTSTVPVAIATTTGQPSAVAGSLTTPVVSVSSARTTGVVQGASSVSPVTSVQTSGAVATSTLHAANVSTTPALAQTITTAVPAGPVSSVAQALTTAGRNHLSAQALTTTGSNNRLSTQSLSSAPLSGVAQLGGSLRSTGIAAQTLAGAGLSVSNRSQPTLAGSLSRYGLALDGRNKSALAPQIQFKNVTLNTALKTLLSRAGSDYVLDLGEVADAQVSADFKGVPLDRAIDTLLDTPAVRSRLVSLDEQDVRVITSSRDDSEPGRLTLRFYKRDATQALAALFAAAHVGCTLSSELQGGAVTASLTNVPFNVALDTILHSLTREMTYRVESGVYRIVPRH